MTSPAPNPAPARLAFIGLGVMGFPMAGHLQTAGHRVCVYNRNSSKAQLWVQQYGGIYAETPQAAAAQSDVVMMCVGNDNDVRSVVYGDTGVLAGLARGGILIDHTTTSATLAQELEQRCAQHGVGFVDAPVSGGQTGAENGQLTIMCGSSPETFDRMQALLAPYARAVTLMGPCGSGQKTKMVNQIAIAGLLQGLAEAVAFGERAGLDMHRAIDVIGQGAAQSWQMQNRGHSMVDARFNFGFAIDWMIKDLGLVLDEAQRQNSTLPVTTLVSQFYTQLSQMGQGRSDTSALVQRLRLPENAEKTPHQPI